MRQRDMTAAIEAGQDAGVLVGFEFEVCVPESYLRGGGVASDTQPVTEKQVEDAFRQNHFVDTTIGDYITLDEFDQQFKLKRPGKYGSLREAYIAKMNKIIPVLQKVWEKNIQEQDRITLRKAINRRGGWEKLAKERYPEWLIAIMPGELQFMYAVRKVFEKLGERAALYGPYWNSIHPCAKIGNQIDNITDWGWPLTEYLNLQWYDTDYIRDDWNHLFRYDPQSVYDIMSARDFDFIVDDEDDDDGIDYRDAADKFAKELKTTYGRPTRVFDDYHQSAKKLDTWYIEPDGSLEPRASDTSFEVVSPPYPAADAARALKDFYALAKQNGFYAGAQYKTGLHINVSIPQNIDVLKLAVILGDQHVLQAFGRQNNEYAQSVYKQLTGSTARRELQRPELSTDAKIAVLQELVRKISSEHFASISSNGKYISFRHAGGSYLDDYSGVVNVLGRFVRSVIIASNPQSHREDYLRGLAKLIGAHQPSADTTSKSALRKKILALHRSGMPALHFDIYSKSTSSSGPNKGAVLAWFEASGAGAAGPTSGLTRFLQPDSSAKDRMLAALPDLAEKVSSWTSGKGWSGTWVPTTLAQYMAVANSQYSGKIKIPGKYWGSVAGYGVVRREVLPKDHPRVAAIFNSLYSQLQQQYKRAE